jgi:hypothetical protein
MAIDTKTAAENTSDSSRWVTVPPIVVDTRRCRTYISTLPVYNYPRDAEITQRTREISKQFGPPVLRKLGVSQCDSEFGNAVSIVYPFTKDHNRLMLVGELTEITFLTDGRSFISLFASSGL